jgi:hypothetical protein
MKGDVFIGVQPTNERWSLDGKVYFEWNQQWIGIEYILWEKGMLKPKLASSKEASFSRLDFKLNQMLI